MSPTEALAKIREDLDRLRVGHPNCKAKLCVPIRLAESRLALAEALFNVRRHVAPDIAKEIDLMLHRAAGGEP